jgi:hypothetical protein
MSIPTGQSPGRRDQSTALECEQGSRAGLPDAGQLDLFGADERSDALALRRLEASVRWLQGEAAFKRLPRAATLSPVHGLAAPSADHGDAEPGDDVVDVRAMDSMMSSVMGGVDEAPVHATVPSILRPSVRPTPPARLTPPQRPRRRGVLRGLFKISLAFAVAAAAAYGFAVLQRLPAMLPDGAPMVGPEFAADARPADTMTTVVAKSTAATTTAVKQPVAIPGDAVPDDAIPADTNAADANADVKNKAAADTVAPQDQPRSSGNASPALAAPEIAAMLARGKTYFDAGDIAAARLLFRRAANAGDAAAALAMGATYDPAVLASRLVLGMSAGTGADVDEARSWYERAREMGSPEGPRRLDMLAHQ